MIKKGQIDVIGVGFNRSCLDSCTKGLYYVRGNSFIRTHNVILKLTNTGHNRDIHKRIKIYEDKTENETNIRWSDGDMDAGVSKYIIHCT